jgi:hypothetical protein
MKILSSYFYKQLNCVVELDGESYSVTWRSDWPEGNRFSIWKVIGGVLIPRTHALYPQIAEFIKQNYSEIS